MRSSLLVVAAVAFTSAVLLLDPVPAAAKDLCLQLSTANGNSDCDFTGQAGFFRFSRARLPKNPKRAVALHGRNAGITGVYGTMVMGTDLSSVSLVASFTTDAVFGTIDLFIDHTNLGGDHWGYSSYGDVSLNHGCNVKIVDYALEP
jgi:hypothetical protein